MPPILYTTAAAVRAALGLSAIELLDQQFVDLEVDAMLSIELRTVYPSHATLHAAVQDGTATPEMTDVYLVLQQYAKYEVATYFLPQFQMIVAQKIADAKTQMERFDANNLSQTIEGVTAQRDRYRGVLNPEEFGAVGVTMFSTVSPSYDPVVNELISGSGAQR